MISFQPEWHAIIGLAVTVLLVLVSAASFAV